MCFEERILDEESNEPEPETEPTSLRDIEWFLFSLKSVGILPFYKVRNQYEIVAPERCSYTRVVLLLKLCLFALHCYLLTTPIVIWTLTYQSDSVNFSKILDLFLCIVDFLVITAVCVMKSNDIIKIFNKLLKVDELLINNCGQDFLQQTTVKYFHNKHLLGILCLAIFTFYTHYISFDPFFVEFYLHVLISFIYTILSSVYFIFVSTMLHMLALRFSQINELVIKMNQTKDSIIRPICRQRVSKRLFESATFGSPLRNTTLYRAHNLLLETFNDLNAYAGFCALIHISYFSYVVTTAVYEVYLFRWHQRGFQLDECIWFLIAMTYYVSHIVLFARCCDDVSVEGSKTKQLIARFKVAKYQNQGDNFLSKTLKQDISFDAWGFFVVNKAALFQIFCAVTTFLIILLQFKQLEDDKSMRFLNDFWSRN